MSLSTYFAGFRNRVLDAEISASSAAANAPAQNLASAALYRPWVSSAAHATEEIWVRYGGELRSISHVGIFDHELDIDDEMRVELYLEENPPAGATPIYNFPAAADEWAPAWRLQWALTGAQPWGQATWEGRPPATVLDARGLDVLIPLLANEKPLRVGHRSLRIRVRGKAALRRIGYLDLSELWEPVGLEGVRGMELGSYSISTVEGEDGRPRLRQQVKFPYQPLAEVNRLQLWRETVGGDYPLVFVPQPTRPESWSLTGLYSLTSLAFRKGLDVGNHFTAELELTAWSRRDVPRQP